MHLCETHQRGTDISFPGFCSAVGKWADNGPATLLLRHNVQCIRQSTTSLNRNPSYCRPVILFRILVQRSQSVTWSREPIFPPPMSDKPEDYVGQPGDRLLLCPSSCSPPNI